MSESENTEMPASQSVAFSRRPKPVRDVTMYAATLKQIAKYIEDIGEKSFRAKQIHDHLYTQRRPLEDMTTWPEALRTKFVEHFPYALEQETYQRSKDHTHKWLYKLNDGKFIETVLMTYPDRSTVCISSQAGCAMGCTFCATGQAGFDRHLNAGEIIEQVARACHASEPRVGNVVFMGMGEPLANVEPVRETCERLVKDFGFSARHITVSTVGVIPGMNAMANWELPVTLAVSLHAPFDDMRSELVPLNKRYPIADVLEAAARVTHTHGRRVSFEYAAIDHTNITDECAHEFGRLLRNFQGAGGAHVNIIPLNDTKKFTGHAPQRRAIERFAEIVTSYGPTVTIRRNRGNDIDAACGQLRERVTESN